jgi:L-fuconolactonase
VTDIVDAHQHFWDPATGDYPWMTDELAAIRRRFAPDDLRPIVERRGVTRTILVQTRSSLPETVEFLDTAASIDFVAGVVGWIDLTDEAIVDVLDRLRSGPTGRWLVGIRHQTHDEPDPDWLTRPDVMRGLRAVARAGLPYDLVIRTRELPASLEIATRIPELALVVDHIAKPDIRHGLFEPWAERMAALAAMPNVTCKVSGLVTDADWSTWTRAELRPYVDLVLGWFGPRRLLFGSDWPVCLLAATYDEVLDAAEELFGGLTAAERDEVFEGTATRVYGL